MSKLKLAYCFSKALSENQSKLEVVLYCLTRSVEINSKFHNIKIYTDSLTVDELSHINTQKEVVDFTPLKFTDDIKIQTLPLLKENEILIDIDVFLKKELVIDYDCDVIGEHPELLSSEWYINDYTKASKYNFGKHIRYSSLSGEVINIGILKFFNKELQSQYFEKYNFVRDLAIEQEHLIPESLPKFSILLGQLLLQNIIDDYKYKVKFARNINHNRYHHLAGKLKYDLGNKLEEFINRRFNNISTI
jgi:hypothetical protein